MIIAYTEKYYNGIAQNNFMAIRKLLINSILGISIVFLFIKNIQTRNNYTNYDD